MVVETMRAEWGCTLRQALFEESLPAAIALWPSLSARNGAEVEQADHVAKARQAAKARARKWLEANYEIIPTPPSERKRRNSPPPPRDIVLDAGR
jgi:ferric-dicitrate binding protein FerR (iron transport regulator)